MVLEGASSPESDPFTQDSTPSSDLDPYGPGQSSLPSPSSTTNMRLPQPVPLIGPLLGYTKSGVKETIDKGLSAASQIVKRPLSREETEALAYQLAKMERTSSVGATLGLMGGLYRSWSTAETYRFPFYKPDLTSFNAEAFAIFRGAASRAAIHALRGLAYGSTGLVIGAVFAKSYAAMVTTVAITSDPRLKEMNKMMREMAQRRAGKPIEQPRQSAPMPQRNDSREPQYDDMSPQSGPYDAPEEGMVTDRDMRAQEVGQQSQELIAQVEQARSTWQKDKATSYGGSSDDTSPQAGTSAPTSRESAWDRVRRQSSQQTARSSADRRVSPAQGATLGDSFSFSATDEERQLAKDEAQKEFDARVERERQGKDFEDGSRGRKW